MGKRELNIMGMEAQPKAVAARSRRPRLVPALAVALACLGTTVLRAADVDAQAQTKSSRATDSHPQTFKPERREAAELDGIMAVIDEHGRTVYVNAPPAKPGKPAAAAKSQSSVLVYWDRKRQSWRPVPPPTPAAMRAARSAAAEVATYVADGSQNLKGKTAGSNLPSAAETASLPAHYRYPSSGHRPSAQEIDRLIEQAAARHKVDPNLVRAVIKVESNFNPWAVSKKGAMGLMQLMPETARQLKVNNPFDPQENVDAGVRHLRTLLDNFGGDVRLSLAAYNAGETAVLRHAGVPNFGETRNYVKQITGQYWASPGRLMAQPRAAPLRVFRDGNGILTMRND
jgi:soluble lytic murein transglycosylase-like protein